ELRVPDDRLPNGPRPVRGRPSNWPIEPRCDTIPRHRITFRQPTSRPETRDVHHWQRYDCDDPEPSGSASQPGERSTSRCRLRVHAGILPPENWAEKTNRNLYARLIA